MKRLILLTAIALMILSSCQKSKNTKSSNSSLLINYLNENAKTPEDYIIEKFDNHDYVIIGEYHRIKHDVDLIVKIIPKLYENGIHNLAMEFGAYPYQDMVDSLLNLPEFDRDLARTIMFKSEPDWAFKEYIDIYEAAWKVNQSLDSTEAKFRVVNLSPDYNPCKKGLERFGGIDYDKHMADVVLSELVSKDKKALIYAGTHHSFTKYYQPVYGFEEKKLYKLEKTRMGNILYDTLKERTFNIFLHSPWVSDQGYDKESVAPVNGLIDSVMKYQNITNVGFDVINTPIGELTATNTLYAFGYQDFTLKQFCDGYIFQNHFEDYEDMAIEENFINSENMDDFISFMKCSGYTDEELKNLTKKRLDSLLKYSVKDAVQHLIK